MFNEFFHLLLYFMLGAISSLVALFMIWLIARTIIRIAGGVRDAIIRYRRAEEDREYHNKLRNLYNILRENQKG